MITTNRRKPHQPFCDHFKRGRCRECENIREKIRNEPRETGERTDGRDYVEEAFYEYSKIWKQELGIRDDDLREENGKIYFFLDGYKVFMPREVYQLSEFKRKLNE